MSKLYNLIIANGDLEVWEKIRIYKAKHRLGNMNKAVFDLLKKALEDEEG